LPVIASFVAAPVACCGAGHPDGIDGFPPLLTTRPVTSRYHPPARPLLLDDREPNAFTCNEASEAPAREPGRWTTPPGRHRTWWSRSSI